MGDFDAKIGSDSANMETVMGQHGLGNMNENGEIFSDFCSMSATSLSLELPFFPINNVTTSHGDRPMQELRTKLTISQSFDEEGEDPNRTSGGRAVRPSR